MKKFLATSLAIALAINLFAQDKGNPGSLYSSGSRNPFTDNPTLALSVDVDEPAPTALTYSPNARTYSPTVRSPAPAARQCCKICRKGQACGNSCIGRTYTCSKPPGCACDGR